MVAIFTTSSTLDRICHTDDYTMWIDMIMKLGKVFTNEDIDIPLDEKDRLFILDQAQKIDKTKSEFISSLSAVPEKVLEEPCGIYLLDITKEKATNIQNEYGVVCQSSSNLHHDVLTHKGFVAELVKYEKKEDKKDEWTEMFQKFNWTDIFNKFKTTPTNSALIIDAYLFTNDSFDERQGCYDSNYSDGITNLKEILEQILPEHFSQTYHIGVLLTNYDKSEQTSLTNKRIATAINKIKKKINRQYEINIEVIFFSHADGHHWLIHNRRILTNTYVLDAQYKLAAFSAEGKSRASQTVSVSPLFELIHLDSDSDMKEQRLRSDLKELSEYIQSQCAAKSPTDQLYRNGQLIESFSQIQHRFLKKP